MAYTYFESDIFTEINNIVENINRNLHRDNFDFNHYISMLKVKIDDLKFIIDSLCCIAEDAMDLDRVQNMISIYDSLVEGYNTLRNNPELRQMTLTMMLRITSDFRVRDHVRIHNLCEYLFSNDQPMPNIPGGLHDQILPYIETVRNLMPVLLGPDRKLNIMLPHYHKIKKSFITDTLPEMQKYISKENLNIYAGINKEGSIDYKTRPLFAGVAIGDPNLNIVTNNAFDIIFDTAVYNFSDTYVYSFSSDNYDTEKDSLLKSLKKYHNYLKSNGLLVLNIPFFSLTKHICLYLKKNFSIIGVKAFDMKFNSYGDDMYKYYLLVLKNNMYSLAADDELGELQYQVLRDLALRRNIDKITSHWTEFEYNTTFRPVRLFKGSELDTSILMASLANSPIYNQVKTTKKHEIKPILPFERGQVGLILASGKLDGVIDEGNGYKHVIRGRVYKNTGSTTEIIKENENNNRGLIQTTRTTTNMTEINILTGSGEYKRVLVPVEIN